MLDQIITAIISGGLTGIITVVTMRADIAWIKKVLADHSERVTFLERSI